MIWSVITFRISFLAHSQHSFTVVTFYCVSFSKSVVLPDIEDSLCEGNSCITLDGRVELFELVKEDVDEKSCNEVKFACIKVIYDNLTYFLNF